MAERADATARVTCQVATWLWRRRKARVIAREVGLSAAGHLTTAWESYWRVDVAGARIADNHVRTFVCEVKGTIADLQREFSSKTRRGNRTGKWHRAELARCHELWLACGDGKTGAYALVNVPAHWGVMVFGDDDKVRTLRRAGRSELHSMTSTFASRSMSGLARALTAERMPAAFNVLGQGGWERLLAEGWAEDSVWTRDNTQLELPLEA